MIRLKQNTLYDDALRINCGNLPRGRLYVRLPVPPNATLKEDVKYEKAPTLYDYGFRCSRDHPRWK